MRIALISDIHGNLVSLEAVLADIKRTGVDQVVCLGDVAAFGPQPREVVARLKALGCPCVMGNHDLDVLNPNLAHEGVDVSPWEVELTNWCVDQLSDADLDYMHSFQPIIDIPLGDGVALLCYHGSPRSPTEKVLATTPASELDEIFADHTAPVMAGGHTHVQMLRQHKGVLIVNPGSVGFPLEQMPFEGMPRYLPWSEYAVVGWVDGVLGIELRRVPMDLDEVRQATLTSGMPRAVDWLDLWRTSA